ncbi:MAG: Na+/H+ antiporter NhaA [Verrucomicrobia bacterium]|nr:MAG: Na+/H+ antiporter NhaA [Verrucomicrobiota bacterium]
MQTAPKSITKMFAKFAASEQSSAILLMICVLLALALANSPSSADYLGIWQAKIGPLHLVHWINDGLMAVFFLLIGLELERELYVGELSSFRNALLPIVAAVGGMAAPALIHLFFNAGSATQSGFGIPMATDIAIALGVLALLGKRVPVALKVFVVAYAVMDDLGAIVVIAIFYTAQLSVGYLTAALSIWALLMLLNLRFRVMSLLPYLVGGALMWALMLKSGVHATIAGVLLAFAVPFSTPEGASDSPSHRLENILHRPVAFLILPLFALANTGIVIGTNWLATLTSANSVGIAAGLLLGKPLGVLSLCALATTVGVCRLPEGVSWGHISGAAILGGIGFTMSIFMAGLAFSATPEILNASKLATLLASAVAGIAGFAWLRVSETKVSR